MFEPEVCAYCYHLNVDNCKDKKYKCDVDGSYKGPKERCGNFCKRLAKDYYKAEKVLFDDKYHPFGSGYHITTMIVNILGLGENCREIIAMKKLRNVYMQSKPEYKALLSQYDIIGPKIAKSMSELPWEEAVNEASHLLVRYIRVATDYVEAGNYKAAIEVYKKMVENLSNKYLTVPFDMEDNQNRYGMSNKNVKKLVLKPVDHTRL